LNRNYKLLIAVLSSVVVLDQFTKLFVDSNMYLYQSIEVWENFFHFTYIRNKGAAFGILSGSDAAVRVPFFLGISALAIFVILYAIHKHKGEDILFPLSLSTILGGAIGNLIDRIRLGEVIDFIDVHWYDHHWPAFNIADSAITVGMGLLIIQMLTEKREA